MELHFYRCAHCGNLVWAVQDSGVPMMCCGEEMQQLVPGTVDASAEKHVPVYQTEGQTVTVQVGAAEHPMLPEHHIEWIALQTRLGYQFRRLRPGDKPQACFILCPDDSVEAVFEHCNLHGLWKA